MAPDFRDKSSFEAQVMRRMNKSNSAANMSKAKKLTRLVEFYEKFLPRDKLAFHAAAFRTFVALPAFLKF